MTASVRGRKEPDTKSPERLREAGPREGKQWCRLWHWHMQRAWRVRAPYREGSCGHVMYVEDKGLPASEHLERCRRRRRGRRGSYVGCRGGGGGARPAVAHVATAAAAAAAATAAEDNSGGALGGDLASGRGAGPVRAAALGRGGAVLEAFHAQLNVPASVAPWGRGGQRTAQRYI